MAKKISSSRVVVTSFLVDIVDILLNLVLAIISGSSVMLVQTLRGSADLITTGLLLVGVRRSKRAADRSHRFGYGREIYFWTLMSGIMMVTLTATISFREGWQQFIAPEELHAIPLALIVLLIGLITNGYSISLGYCRLLANSHSDSIVEAFVSTVLVETKATFVLDAMGIAGSLFGFISLFLYLVTGNSQFDGLGAMIIGVITALLALLLIIDVKDLIVGRGVSPEAENEIKQTALAIKGVEKVFSVRTMYLGSERLLVNIELDVEKHLKTEQIERLIDIIKAEIKSKVPNVHHIQVELETA